MQKAIRLILAICLILSVLPAAVAGASEALPSLQEFYTPYFDFGSAMSSKEAADTDREAFYAAQYSIVTPENALKPDSVIDLYSSAKAAKTDQGSVAVHFQAVKSLLDMAKRNGLKVNGHVLFWHQQTPDRFFRENYDKSKPYVSREVMLSRMETYVRLIMEYLNENYPGIVVSFDVVNEAIDDATGKLRESNYTRIVGDDWVLQAFRFARKYAPKDMLLVYNDYSVPYNPKSAGIMNLLDELIAEDLVDVCGMQCHYQMTTPSLSQFETAIKHIVKRGLKIRITELDILVDNNTQASFEKQATRYANLMGIMLRYADSIIAVQTWGTFDTQSWKSGNYPLLFHGDGTAKPAFYALTDSAILP